MARAARLPISLHPGPKLRVREANILIVAPDFESAAEHLGRNQIVLRHLVEHPKGTMNAQPTLNRRTAQATIARNQYGIQGVLGKDQRETIEK